MLDDAGDSSPAGTAVAVIMMVIDVVTVDAAEGDCAKASDVVAAMAVSIELEGATIGIPGSGSADVDETSPNALAMLDGGSKVAADVAAATAATLLAGASEVSADKVTGVAEAASEASEEGAASMDADDSWAGGCDCDCSSCGCSPCCC